MTTEKTNPHTLTVEEALARLRTWREEPAEDEVAAVITAARAYCESETDESRVALREAVRNHDDCREMTYQATGFGCDIDAETARQDLREAEEIVESDAFGLNGALMRARGCHIAAKVKRLDGRWVGFASRKRD